MRNLAISVKTILLHKINARWELTWMDSIRVNKNHVNFCSVLFKPTITVKNPWHFKKQWKSTFCHKMYVIWWKNIIFESHKRIFIENRVSTFFLRKCTKLWLPYRFLSFILNHSATILPLVFFYCHANFLIMLCLNRNL